ncbi:MULTISPECIES: hypothetical protein [Nonomuraea]|uniref:Uncharacterized protein n=1 Tax=Nonomuraea mangrovi TaxID=2316207 RepID=A0ABW4TBQ6_9ACTN
MSDLEAIADRIEIETLLGEFTDAVMMRLRRPCVSVRTRRRVGGLRFVARRGRSVLTVNAVSLTSPGAVSSYL